MLSANDLLKLHDKLIHRIEAIELTPGKDGVDGKSGKDGKDGKSVAGVNGRDGKKGRDGKDGTSYEAPEELLLDELTPHSHHSSHTVNHGVQGTEELRASITALSTLIPQVDTTVSPVTANTTALPGDVIVCTNTADIVISLPLTPDVNSRVSVARAGTGGVTVSGNGEVILGEVSQVMPQQWDMADMMYTSVGWVLT